MICDTLIYLLAIIHFQNAFVFSAAVMVIRYLVYTIFGLHK